LQSILIGLSEDQTTKFLSLVTEYEDIFSNGSSDLGKSDLLEHALNAGDCDQLNSVLVEYHPISEKLYLYT